MGFPRYKKKGKHDSFYLDGSLKTDHFAILAKNHGTVVIEDLNVSGMMSNHKLAKAIQDMGFCEFRRQLEYKTKLYGSEISYS